MIHLKFRSHKFGKHVQSPSARLLMLNSSESMSTPYVELYTVFLISRRTIFLFLSHQYNFLSLNFKSVRKQISFYSLKSNARLLILESVPQCVDLNGDLLQIRLIHFVVSRSIISSFCFYSTGTYGFKIKIVSIPVKKD
jgi:hypothetical protein